MTMGGTMTDQTKDRRWIVAWIVMAVLFVLILICCFLRKGRGGVDVVVRFVCPGDPVVIDLVDRETGALLHSTTGVPLSEPITNIPEFHDCQRFINGGKYDSLYAIFASFRLDTLQEKFGRDSSLAGTEGRPYGIVPAATIYSHGGTYDQLGIKPGFNCLFFYKSGTGAQRQWAARMVPWGGSLDPDCGDRRFDAYTTGTDLEVKPNPNTGFSSADNAPVARWDWDSQNQQHYIGIACGAEWCEVGKPGFQPSADYSLPVLTWGPLNGVTPQNTSVTYKRVFTVRGWFDAQQLETMTSSVMQPGPAFGFFIPHPELERANALGLDAYTDKWNHVAMVVVNADYLKWNYKTGQNEIWFCYGTPATCKITSAMPRVTGSSTPLLGCPHDPTNPGRYWWAMIVSAAKDTAYSCVERRDHSGELAIYMAAHPKQMNIRMPGATRWRYLPTDPGDWISCPGGCCTIK
jgi:hypothetical protein